MRSTRQFVFFLALTKVNVKLGLMGFVNDENITTLKFQKKLARALIFHSWCTLERMSENPTANSRTQKKDAI